MQMKSKESLIALILMIMLTIAMLLQMSQITVQAVVNAPTYLYVSVAPDPVGVDQTVYISLFFSKPIPPSFGALFGGGQYKGLTVNVVRPDGTNQTFGPYTTDTTGGVGGIEFVPTDVGNYTVQAFYPGQAIAGTVGVNLNPAVSPPVTFVVQQTPIPTYSSPPLPTEYWSRSIYATNYGWAALGGNWWGLGRPAFHNTGGYDASGNNFNAYSQAPNTAHIMWTKPTAFGGQPGEPITPNAESQYSSTSILYNQFEPIILNGIVYYDWHPSTPNVEAGWIAVDIRTGETLWTKTTTDTLTFGEVVKFHNAQEYGSQAWLWAISSSNDRYNLYDPMSGAYVASVVNLPSSLIGLFGASPAGLIDMNETETQGSVLFHWISGGNLTMWNSTLCFVGPSPFLPGYGANRPTGNMSFSRGIQWSVPVATKIDGNTISPALGITAITNEAILVTSYPAIIPTFANEWPGAYAIDAAYNTKTGKLLWGPVNRTLPNFHETPVLAAGDGYYVRHDKDTNQAYGYSLLTGQQLWGPVQLKGNSLSVLARGGAIAYGKVYIWDFGGYVNAIDLKNGTVSWTFTRGSSGYDTPYGVYPIWHFGSHSIADGKLFLAESRMYDRPLFPNARRLAINCTDGSLVWSVLGFYGRDPGVIADGFLLSWNCYDCQIYTFGKGQTATTATIQNNVLTYGGNVLITGTVMDKSPGTKNSDRIARFPDGVPAVSEESMPSFMEYVYMQQPKPINTTGVPVTLSVIDANGNYRQIGSTTTDANGFYSYQWTPDIPGKYTVYASFGGSESYWSSYTETAMYVQEAPPTTPPPQYPVPIDYTMPITGAAIAVIIAVAIVGILMLRKRP